MTAIFPFVSSADETPIRRSQHHGISSSLDANGLASSEMNGFGKSEMAVL